MNADLARAGRALQASSEYPLCAKEDACCREAGKLAGVPGGFGTRRYECWPEIYVTAQIVAQQKAGPAEMPRDTGQFAKCRP